MSEQTTISEPVAEATSTSTEADKGPSWRGSMSDNDARARENALDLVTEIDQAELAIRIMERALMIKRKNGKISRDLLDESERLLIASGDDFPFRDMARIAIEYFGECIKKAQRPS